MITIVEANKIIKDFQEQAPVDVLKIAQALGLRVYKYSKWPDDISGMIKKDKEIGGNAGFAIFVNANHHLNRQRFTVAHEIAHYVYHVDEIGDAITDDALYRSSLSDAKESMANKYAAEILMPWSLIKKEMEKGRKSLTELAKIFEVSESAIALRFGVPSND